MPGSDLWDAVERMLAVERDLNDYILQREDEIRGAMLALVARSHVFYLSPPGAAKSMLASEVCRRVHDASFYKLLMTQFTLPEELFGPYSITRLRDEGVLERRTAGYLPTAHVAQLDEIWKTHGAIINTLLTLINEREFTNAGKVERAPLITLFVTSNEIPPVDRSLAAIYDRVALRYEMHPVKDVETRQRIAQYNRLIRGLEHLLRTMAPECGIGVAHPDRLVIDRYGPILSNPEVIAVAREGRVPAEIVAISDPAEQELVAGAVGFLADHDAVLSYHAFVDLPALDLLHAAALEVTFSPGVEAAFYQILDELPAASTRRELELRTLVGAAAVLGHRDTAALADLGVLRHTLWDDPRQRQGVNQVVDQVTGRAHREAERLLDAVRDTVAPDPVAKTIDIVEQINRAKQIRIYREKLAHIVDDHPGEPDLVEMLRAANDLEATFQASFAADEPLP